MRARTHRPYHPAWWVMGAIRLYQRLISPGLGGNCRYRPTCSEYAATAVDRYGVIKGGWMAIKRVGRCHPFREGGYDPVPTDSAVRSGS